MIHLQILTENLRSKKLLLLHITSYMSYAVC